MKKLLLLLLASLTTGGTFANRSSTFNGMPKANLNTPATQQLQSNPEASVTSPMVSPKAAGVNFFSNLSGEIDEVNCLASLAYVIEERANTSYRVHFISINGDAGKSTPLQTLCEQLLHNGLHITFSGNNSGNGEITGSNLRF